MNNLNHEKLGIGRGAWQEGDNIGALRRIFLPYQSRKLCGGGPLLRFNAEGTHLPENYGVRINENQSTKYYMEKRRVFSHEHFVSIRVYQLHIAFFRDLLAPTHRLRSHSD